MELDTCNVSSLRVARLVVELARHSVDSAVASRASCDLVTKLLEVILEHIDDFVGLELALNSGCHSVNEGIQAFPKLQVRLESFGCLTVEILGIVGG